MKSSSETLRITRTLELVQREKVADECALLDKQSRQLHFLQRKIAEVRRGIIGKRSMLVLSVESLKKHLHLEKLHLGHMQAIVRTIQRLDAAMKRMSSTRKFLLGREHSILGDMEEFLEKNHETLRYGELSSILNKKKKILADTASLLNKEQSILFADEAVARSIAENQQSIVEKMEHAVRERISSLHELTTEHDLLLKKELSFNRQLKSIDVRRRTLQKKMEKK